MAPVPEASISMTAHDSTDVPTPVAPSRVAAPADAVPRRAGTAMTVGDSAAAGEERDYVNEDSIQSFPASDPPGWISMWLGPPINAEHP
jgi:hypothetical protein